MDDKDNGEIINHRICRLRQKMQEHQIDAYLILSYDFHISEYVGDYFKCIAYLTGFTGSAGAVVITQKEVCLWVDGRYFVQAQEQLDRTGILLKKIGEEGVATIREYLKQILGENQTLGYDGRCVSAQYDMELKEYLKDHQIIFQEGLDLVGDIWSRRPGFAYQSITELPLKYAGKSTTRKLWEVRGELSKQGLDALFIASLDDIAWLYNLRGSDIAYTPVFFAYTLIYQTKAVLYLKDGVVEDGLLHKLQRDHIEIRPYELIYEDLKQLNSISLLIDLSTTNVALKNAVSSQTRMVYGISPTTVLKAVKNDIEIKNERYAHLLDGIAVTKLIYRLKQSYESGIIGNLTELDICEQLESLRRRGDHYMGQSFSPIVATGAHAAIVHYEPTVQTNTPIEIHNFLLMDTGGHYLYGTTDITRTIAIGRLTYEQKKLYTAVLQGHIRLGNARFEFGVTDDELDHLAREPLSALGYHYKHGTGHGVGYFLCVHEGPPSIRPNDSGSNQGSVLKKGMITSDEPGVYVTGQYGIRIENMLLCREMNEISVRTDKKGKSSKKVLGFEHLTLVPYEREAILPEMMTQEEIHFINEYHRWVYEQLSPYLEKNEREWLKEQTMEIVSISL